MLLSGSSGLYLTLWESLKDFRGKRTPWLELYFRDPLGRGWTGRREPGWGRGSRKGKDRFVGRMDSAATTLGPHAGVEWGWGRRRQERGGAQEGALGEGGGRFCGRHPPPKWSPLRGPGQLLYSPGCFQKFYEDFPSLNTHFPTWSERLLPTPSPYSIHFLPTWRR